MNLTPRTTTVQSAHALLGKSLVTRILAPVNILQQMRIYPTVALTLIMITALFAHATLGLLVVTVIPVNVSTKSLVKCLIMVDPM